MEKLSLYISIASLIVGVISIGVSIYCWRHNYEKQKEHNKIIQKLNALQFDNEYIFSDLTQIILKAKKENIDISDYFNKPIKNNSKNAITKNELLSAIYNMIMSKEFQENEINTRNKR